MSTFTTTHRDCCKIEDCRAHKKRIPETVIHFYMLPSALWFDHQTKAANMNAIWSILDGHEPALEPEVREYIEGLVRSAQDEDGGSDDLSVGDVLSNFLSLEESNVIISQIQLQREGKIPVKSHDNPHELLPMLLEDDGGHSSPFSLHDTAPSTKQTNASQPLQLESTSAPAKNTKSKSQQRKEARLKRKTAKQKKSKTDNTTEPELVNDDHASAWKECQESAKKWGGRGHGGRGIRLTGNNFDCIHLPSVSISFEGNELLVDSTMDIVKGHRYGLVGRNGVGKSTLLRQLEAGAIPGMPQGMVIQMVKQQIEGREDQTALEALVEADLYRTALLEEQKQVEKDLDSGVNLEENALRIGDIAEELDAIDADNAEKRALDILLGLSFSQTMIKGYTNQLSGGWRMRLALAQALFAPYSDLILLDECTNHLDLHGMAWLENYLTKEHGGNPFTLICVSHDKSFLDNVCTDIVVMEHKRLSCHSGNYSDYIQKMNEKAAREQQILDAADRQRSKAMAFVQKQQNSKKSSDPNKQRQAKMIKEKKLDRIGNYREDGKRYKSQSLKKLSEDYVRLAKKVVIEVDDPVVRLKFPNPSWPLSVTEGSPIIQMEDVSFSYSDPRKSGKEEALLLQHVTLNITKNTKAAIVGRNGAGKTSWLKLLVGEIDDARVRGTIWRHPNIRIGHITQYSVEELNKFSHMTVLEYAEEKLSSGEASSSIIAKSSGNVRQYLGAFGLGGNHATRPIRALSGGERMRLCFATVLSRGIHLLILDESTNHIDIETLDSLSAALSSFQGAIVMVSHNQSFLSGFCNELWSFSEQERGRIDISHDDTESFDELFSRYRSNILSGSASSAGRGRQSMAKRAAKHSASAPKSTALL